MRQWILHMYTQYLAEHPELKGGSIVTIPKAPSSVWVKLVSEGRYDLINVLMRVERKEEGYGTIIIPKKGFSDKQETHNAVLLWLRARKVNVYSPEQEINELKEALS